MRALLVPAMLSWCSVGWAGPSRYVQTPKRVSIWGDRCAHGDAAACDRYIAAAQTYGAPEVAQAVRDHLCRNGDADHCPDDDTACRFGDVEACGRFLDGHPDGWPGELMFAQCSTGDARACGVLERAGFPAGLEHDTFPRGARVAPDGHSWVRGTRTGFAFGRNDAELEYYQLLVDPRFLDHAGWVGDELWIPLWVGRPEYPKQVIGWWRDGRFEPIPAAWRSVVAEQADWEGCRIRGRSGTFVLRCRAPDRSTYYFVMAQGRAMAPFTGERDEPMDAAGARMVMVREGQRGVQELRRRGRFWPIRGLPLAEPVGLWLDGDRLYASKSGGSSVLSSRSPYTKWAPAEAPATSTVTSLASRKAPGGLGLAILRPIHLDGSTTTVLWPDGRPRRSRLPRPSATDRSSWPDHTPGFPSAEALPVRWPGAWPATRPSRHDLSLYAVDDAGWPTLEYLGVYDAYGDGGFVSLQPAGLYRFEGILGEEIRLLGERLVEITLVDRWSWPVYLGEVRVQGEAQPTVADLAGRARRSLAVGEVVLVTHDDVSHVVSLPEGPGVHPVRLTVSRTVGPESPVFVLRPVVGRPPLVRPRATSPGGLEARPADRASWPPDP